MARTPMSDDHKAALAEGRRQGAAVRAYLDALESNRPTRGRKRSVESIERKLQEIEASLPSASGEQRLQMIQARTDLARELDKAAEKVDMAAVENAFVEVAAAYGERKGIEYATWREFGVSAAVLQSAGIARTRG